MRGTVTAVAGRGVGILVGLATVPLTIGYLGGERYGIWVTISTFLAFLSFTDFGIANSLSNALGKLYGEGQSQMAARYVSSAFLIFCLISATIAIAAIIFAPHLAPLLFPHLQSPLARAEVGPALLLALLLFALNIPLLITNKVLAVHHQIALSNLWGIAGSIANLGAILTVIWSRGGLPWLVLGSSGLGFLMNAACAAWVFGFRWPELRPRLAELNTGAMRELLSAGWKFLVIGAVWMVNSETDNLVIAHYLGAARVTPYAITFAVFANATLLQTLAYPSLWPAYTEAFARKDFVWMRRTFRSHMQLGFVSACAIVIFLTFFGSAIIRFWAGETAVPPFATILWMGIWNLMLATLYVASCLLNATGHLKGMTIYGTITAVLNIALSIPLAKIYGISGVIAATVIAFAVANYIPTFIEVRMVLRKFALAAPAPG
ncbi:MAG: polysaccharide biosynthesis C-terminal domain-containing protein [Verrucomicrobiota bacterium]|nr:polysaccharide biosynthesis C-terminal domain-containing protein [Verrucomicrobiota bacterium]